MEYVIGIGLALVLAWLFNRAGTLIRERTGRSFEQYPAVAIGVGVALALWLTLRLTTEIPQPIMDGLGIGPAVGLSQGLRKPRDPEQK